MKNIWMWITIMAVAFCAMLFGVSATQVDRDAAKQKFEIECLKADGKIEFIFGSGATCTHK